MQLAPRSRSAIHRRYRRHQWQQSGIPAIRRAVVRSFSERQRSSVLFLPCAQHILDLMEGVPRTTSDWRHVQLPSDVSRCLLDGCGRSRSWCAVAVCDILSSVGTTGSATTPNVAVNTM